MRRATSTGITGDDPSSIRELCAEPDDPTRRRPTGDWNWNSSQPGRPLTRRTAVMSPVLRAGDGQSSAPADSRYSRRIIVSTDADGAEISSSSSSNSTNGDRRSGFADKQPALQNGGPTELSCCCCGCAGWLAPGTARCRPPPSDEGQGWATGHGHLLGRGARTADERNQIRRYQNVKRD